MKYTIKFEINEIENSSYRAIPIVEQVENNDCVGDSIGFYKEGNQLEISEYVDVDNRDIREFVKENFNDYKAVLGFIRNSI